MYNKLSTTMIITKLFIELPILALLLLSLIEGTTVQPKLKRQIYREQVLPSRGGKIPETAFRTDRLALNRLNKEGISIPDGLLLEHRNVHVHPHINQHDPEVEDSILKVVQKPEDRFVAPPGKSYPNTPPTVKSTYIIRKPVGSENPYARRPSQQIPLTSYDQENNLPNQYLPQNPDQKFVTLPPSGKYLPTGFSAPQQNFFPESLQSQNIYSPPSTSSNYSPPPKFYSAPLLPPPPPPPALPPTSPIPPINYVPVVSPHQNIVQVQVSRQKYLPGGVTYQKYIPVPPKKYSSPSPPTIVEHPHPYGYAPPVSYQHIQQPAAYFPIVKPLELPNKEAIKYGQYFSDSQGKVLGNQGDYSDVHGLNLFPQRYPNIPNNFLNYDSFDSNVHSQFLTPEVLGYIDSASKYYATGNRYARKSKEVSFVGSDKLKNEKLLLKVKCATGAENAIEDASSQCYVQY